jgi:two-component system, chemotaxis family, protein-glutamate methylesterase/glutaminase
MPKISLLIASPSPIKRAKMAKLIASLSEMEVVGLTENLPETFTLAEARAPDMVVVDEEFCRMNEWTAMRSLFHALNSAWIVWVADANHPPPGLPDLLPDEPLLDLSQSPQVMQERLRQAVTVRRLRRVVPRALIPSSRALKDNFIVVMGASTGGVDTLLTILSSFPEDCPPTAIVQHTGRGFSDSLVRLLDRRSKPEVVAATDGLEMARGRVCLAAGIDGHLHLKPGNPVRCQIVKGAPVSGHVPSADVLFRSALPFAPNVLGVILTGMGQDGAAGLLDLRRADCQTLGQDAATSVVFGMPKAAHGIGAVERLLPDREIAAEIMRICRGSESDPANLRRAAP